MWLSKYFSNLVRIRNISGVVYWIHCDGENKKNQLYSLGLRDKAIVGNSFSQQCLKTNCSSVNCIANFLAGSS